MWVTAEFHSPAPLLSSSVEWHLQQQRWTVNLFFMTVKNLPFYYSMCLNYHSLHSPCSMCVCVFVCEIVSQSPESAANTQRMRRMELVHLWTVSSRSLEENDPQLTAGLWGSEPQTNKMTHWPSLKLIHIKMYTTKNKPSPVIVFDWTKIFILFWC